MTEVRVGNSLKVIGKLKFNYKDLSDYFNLIKFKNSKI